MNEHSLTEILLFSSPVIYTHPPFPDDAVHDVNVVLDSSVPVMQSSFPSHTEAQITAPFEIPFDSSEGVREIFSKEHDVMVTTVPFCVCMSGEERVSVVDGLTLNDVRLSIPDEAEKREYPIDESDGVNVMEDTLRSHPPQMKRESVNEDDELNGLVTTLSPSG